MGGKRRKRRIAGEADVIFFGGDEHEVFRCRAREQITTWAGTRTALSVEPAGQVAFRLDRHNPVTSRALANSTSLGVMIAEHLAARLAR